MSNNKRRTSRTKASSKNTDLYTPDTAPIVYDDSSTVTSVESETPISVQQSVTEEKPSSSATLKGDVPEETKVVTSSSSDEKLERYKMSLRHSVSCKVVGLPAYRGVTMIEMKEVVSLILKNSLGRYAVSVRSQTENQIIDLIENAGNAILETELTDKQKAERIARFKEDCKIYKM